MKSHGKSKAVIAAVIFEVNLLQSSRFGEPYRLTQLGDIASLVNRIDPKSNAPIMMLSAGNGFIMQSEKYSRDNAGQSLKKYILLKQGELAYNHGASKAKQFGCCYELTEPEARIPYVYHCFKINEHEYTPYIAMTLNNPKMDKQLKRLVSSSVRMDGLLNISFEDYMSVSLHLPSTNEQKRIANFIQKIDERIVAQEKLLASLKKYKRGLLMYYFSDDNTRQWMYYSVSQIGKVITGSTPPTNDRSNYDGNLLFCSPGDVGGKKYISSTEKRVSPKGFAFGRPLPPNAVIVTCIGLIGKLGIATTDMITNQQINALVVSEGFDYEFIYYAFENFFPEYRSKVSMQTLPILSKSEFEKLMIKVPILDVQLKISSHLAAMDRRIEHTQQELNALLEQRRGFMQQLFI